MHPDTSLAGIPGVLCHRIPFGMLVTKRPVCGAGLFHLGRGNAPVVKALKPAVPQAGSSTVSVFFGSMISTVKSMICRGVRNCPASPRGAEDAQQILESIPQPFAVVVAELVDDLEEGLERLGIAIGQRPEVLLKEIPPFIERIREHGLRQT